MAPYNETLVPAILRLPDEILLKITTRLEGASGDLHRLALTHRRFRFVVREALVREGRVSALCIPKFILLLSENPGLIPQIRHIDILKDRTAYNGSFTPDRDAQEACAGFVEELALDMTLSQRRTALVIAIKEDDFWMLVLLAILPHAKTLTVRSDKVLSDITYLTSLERSKEAFKRVLKGQVMRMGLGRMESLSIVVDKDDCDPPILRDYEALRNLTISGICLAQKITLFSDALMPASLEVLRILCGRYQTPWHFLTQLRWAIAKERHPKLRNIQLLFDEPCQSFAKYAQYTDPQSPDYHMYSHVAGWDRTGVAFQTLFKEIESQDVDLTLAQYTPRDLLWELQHTFRDIPSYDHRIPQHEVQSRLRYARLMANRRSG